MVTFHARRYIREFPRERFWVAHAYVLAHAVRVVEVALLPLVRSIFRILVAIAACSSRPSPLARTPCQTRRPSRLARVSSISSLVEAKTRDRAWRAVNAEENGGCGSKGVRDESSRRAGVECTRARDVKVLLRRRVVLLSVHLLVNG